MGVEIDISNLGGNYCCEPYLSFDAQNELLDNIFDNELYNQNCITV